jgi:dihydroceramide fatty acyl 2-hydroxylase
MSLYVFRFIQLRPVLARTEMRRMQQRENISFLARLCFVGPVVPLLLFGPVVLALLFWVDLSWGAKLGAVVGGLLVWTWVEYAVHRWLFHARPHSHWGRRLLYMAHGMHHERPRDPLRVVTPPPTSIGVGTLFYILFVNSFGPAWGGAFFAGFASGYLCYDLLHYALHHRGLRHLPGGLWLKRWHMRHHFGGEGHGFGVTSPLWDYLCATAPPRHSS